MKRSRTMTLDECAIRMTAFLAKPARKGKTRKYLSTLPKRPRLIVRAEDYAPSPRPFTPTINAVATNGDHVATFVRKDRRRPKARTKKQAGRWSCRPDGRLLREWSIKTKPVRSLLDTIQQRTLLHSAQNGICALCGDRMHGPALAFSLDHVIPRSLGGCDGLGNLVLCHGECNGEKTNDAPTGCELVWLLAVNSQLGVKPNVF